MDDNTLPSGFKRKLAEEIHRTFIDRMFSQFGISEHPGYCDVHLKPLLCDGGFLYNTSRDLIYLSDIIDGSSEIVETASHESGHFLHRFARRYYQQHKKGLEGQDYLLGEIIAHLGSIIFLNDIKDTTTLSYLLNDSPCYAGIIASKLYSHNKNILPRLTNISMIQAQPIIVRVLGQEVDVARNPYAV